MNCCWRLNHSSQSRWPHHNAPKKELDSRVHAKRDRNLAKNLMVHVENSPKTLLIRMSFRGVNGVNGKIPSSTCNFAITKLLCNGLRNAKRAHETFVINLGNIPSSSKVNEPPPYARETNVWKLLPSYSSFFPTISQNNKLIDGSFLPHPYRRCCEMKSIMIQWSHTSSRWNLTCAKHFLSFSKWCHARCQLNRWVCIWYRHQISPLLSKNLHEW